MPNPTSIVDHLRQELEKDNWDMSPAKLNRIFTTHIGGDPLPEELYGKKAKHYIGSVSEISLQLSGDNIEKIMGFILDLKNDLNADPQWQAFLDERTKDLPEDERNQKKEELERYLLQGYTFKVNASAQKHFATEANSFAVMSKLVNDAIADGITDAQSIARSVEQNFIMTNKKGTAGAMIDAAKSNIVTNLDNNTTTMIKGDIDNLLQHRNMKLLTESQKNMALNRLVSEVDKSLSENNKYKIKAVLKEMPDNFVLNEQNQHLSKYMKSPTLGDRFNNLWQSTKQALDEDKPLGKLARNAANGATNLWQNTKKAFDEDKPLGKITRNAANGATNLWQNTKKAFDEDKPLGKITRNVANGATNLWQNTKKAFDKDKPLGKITRNVANSATNLWQRTKQTFASNKPSETKSKNRSETPQAPKAKSNIKEKISKKNLL